MLSCCIYVVRTKHEPFWVIGSSLYEIFSVKGLLSCAMKHYDFSIDGKSIAGFTLYFEAHQFKRLLDKF